MSNEAVRSSLSSLVCSETTCKGYPPTNPILTTHPITHPSNRPKMPLKKPKQASPPTATTTTLPPPDSQISPTASLTYWSTTPSTISGMLGGFPQVSRLDISGSRAFLSKLRRLPHNRLPQPPQKLKHAADCGAGIGRITTNFLLAVSEHIDVIEPISKFTDELRSTHPSLFTGDAPVVSDIFNIPLESWTPSRRYDLIWNQWCLGHLTDSSLTAYLRRLIPWLSIGGWIVVKENLSTDVSGEDEFDEEDSSVTRSRGKFERIFGEAGLKVVRTEVQGGGFGRGLGLMPVRMWGLQPA